MTRTVLEGKPLLQEDRAQVFEEEAKERFFGRIAVLSLGVRLSTTRRVTHKRECRLRSME